MSDKRIRVLVIHASPWNDQTSGNNVLTNWFYGANVELANIYRGAGMPQNECCQHYFQITDKMMLKSLISKKKAGKSFNIEQGEQSENSTPDKKIKFLKKINNGFTSILRSLVWLIGRYDEKALAKFIREFSPDVVFTCRKASLATLRLERVVRSYTDAPFVAFTGDDEYSLMQWRFDPFFWIERFLTRWSLRNNAQFYQRYLTLSEEQAENYKRIFGCKTGVLRKCAAFNLYDPEKKCKKPIRMVYAGKLYCNRWRTILKLSDAIASINSEYSEEIFTLDIYAVGDINKQFLMKIRANKACHIHPPVLSNELLDIYRNSNIVLHVESFDLRNKWDTRLSFSTKIIDCLGSGCAVMVICWDHQTGFKYLKNEDAAICISSISGIKQSINNIATDPSIVDCYTRKAEQCLKKNHDKTTVQNEIISLLKL